MASTHHVDLFTRPCLEYDGCIFDSDTLKQQIEGALPAGLQVEEKIWDPSGEYSIVEKSMTWADIVKATIKDGRTSYVIRSPDTPRRRDASRPKAPSSRSIGARPPEPGPSVSF